MITLFEAREKVKAIVAERPDNVADCYYAGEWEYKYDENGVRFKVYPDTPSTGICVIGCLLEREGVPLESMIKIEGNSLRNTADLLARVGVEVTPDARRYLSLVQKYQDDFYTWAEAMAMADSVAWVE